MLQSDACPTGDQEVAGYDPPPSPATFFVEINRKMFSTVNPFLPLIQGRQWSVLAKECAQVLSLTALRTVSLPRKKVWIGKLTALDLTPVS